MVEISHKIQFEGKDADNHQIDAYTAAQSLEGLIWSISLTTHFGVTGEVRQRGNLRASSKIFISPPRRGSVIYDLNILVQEHPFLSLIIGGYTVNTVTPYINALIKYTFQAAMSGLREVPQELDQFFARLDEKKLEGLIERVEPPLTRAHKAVEATVDQISLISRQSTLATFDETSKSYLGANATGTFQNIDTNITSYNVLTRNGRLYHPDERTTVPFFVLNNAQSGTSEKLTASMNKYTAGRRGKIRIIAERVETTNGRLAKMNISSAEYIPSSDWEDGLDPLNSQTVVHETQKTVRNMTHALGGTQNILNSFEQIHQPHQHRIALDPSPMGGGDTPPPSGQVRS